MNYNRPFQQILKKVMIKIVSQNKTYWLTKPRLEIPTSFRTTTPQNTK